MKRPGYLPRYTRMEPGEPPKRRKGLRARSKKTEAVYRERRPLVKRLLEERPACERCDQARSEEIHEPAMRSRGADILDPAQCVALCHACHAWIHRNPAAATAEGWLIPSGEAA